MNVTVPVLTLVLRVPSKKEQLLYRYNRLPVVARKSGPNCVSDYIVFRMCRSSVVFVVYSAAAANTLVVHKHFHSCRLANSLNSNAKTYSTRILIDPYPRGERILDSISLPSTIHHPHHSIHLIHLEAPY
jgi:hypothetical protein